MVKKTVEFSSEKNYIGLKEVCAELSISMATGRNWVKLGKLMPEEVEKGKYYFSRSYVSTLKKMLQSGENKALKTRRNKKYVSGNGLYRSYVSENCRSLGDIQGLLQKLEETGETFREKEILVLLADAAVKLLAQRYKAEKQENYTEDIYAFQEFLHGNISFGSYDCLVWALLEDRTFAERWVVEHKEFVQFPYQYEEREDILGLLYISCKNIGSRKAVGAYYTPTKVVRQLVTKLMEKSGVVENTVDGDAGSGKLLLDPCCGTGNFLLQLPDCFTMEQIYGFDIDEVSVKLARLNMVLRFKDTAVELVCSNILCQNFLFTSREKRFDYIVGNPPWGYTFSEEEAGKLRKKYRSAVGRTVESYDVFVEQALSKVKRNGIVSFVLPEAVLNVKLHQPVRTLLTEQTDIQYLEFLGNSFDQVLCPSVIFQFKNTGTPMTAIGMEVAVDGQNFEIQKEREITPEYFSFAMTDEEYRMLRKISKPERTVFLKGNADFALGIVTGNNTAYLSKAKTKENEVVLKGTDIDRFRVKEAENYIRFQPEEFQQIAPVEKYRAQEKLLYRFISNQLVFAYDDKQRLSLNSCNLLIPQIPGLQVKYVLAILNSRVAQFFFQKQFRSVKVLRAHIEQIPIPVATEEEQKQIVELVEKLLVEQTTKEEKFWYEKLEKEVYRLYGLHEEEYEKIKNAQVTRVEDVRDIKLIEAAMEKGKKDRRYYEAYDERYKTVHEQGIRWFGEESSPIVAEIISRYHISKDNNILEIGCGEGRDAQVLLKAGFPVLATDISPKAIAFCKTMLPAYQEQFQVLDCVKGSLSETFDFIYAVAVVHMLVLEEDRNAFYRFIYNHLTAEGVALICSMGDGTMEFQSDIRTAFDLQERSHGGKTVLVAGTSCRVVSRETFGQELAENGLEIVEQGITCVPEQFPEMLYAVVKKGS